MRLIVTTLLILGVTLYARCDNPEDTTREKEEEQTSLLQCIVEDDIARCFREKSARDIDNIEMQITGKKSEPSMSSVIEQTGNFVAEIFEDLQEDDAQDQDEKEEDRGLEEARRKKFGKKKKKHLQKLLNLLMLFKAKLGLLLQLISTHFQLKFFVIAIISLALNVAKFWLDLKKSHPSKVIYYEHAQHQHHYDHDEHDHGGYWARSSNDSPQNLAYSAYAPEQ